MSSDDFSRRAAGDVVASRGRGKSIASPFENTQDRLRSFDFAQDDRGGREKACGWRRSRHPLERQITDGDIVAICERGKS
jgi:hypothetical protein